MEKNIVKYMGLGIAILTLAFEVFADRQGAAAVGKEAGADQTRLGTIELDRSGKRFTVPGTVIRIEPPLEFLAVTKGGAKAYESMLELDANAFEFNTACILIGLDAEGARLPRFHFDETPLEGDRVGIEVSWTGADGQEIRRPAGKLLKDSHLAEILEEWIYTGSVHTENNRYLAADDGTLIGVVHDPASVIEHRQGLGLGDYGAVGANPQTTPPLGTRVRLTVRKLE